MINKKHKKGFSIPEILISISLVLIVFIALMAFLSSMTHQVERVAQSSMTRKTAVFVAQSILSSSKYYQFYSEGGDFGLLDQGKNRFLNPVEQKNIFDILALAMNTQGGLVKVSECNCCELRTNTSSCSINSKCIKCDSRVGASFVPSSRQAERGLFRVRILGIKKISENQYKTFLNMRMLSPAK